MAEPERLCEVCGAAMSLHFGPLHPTGVKDGLPTGWVFGWDPDLRWPDLWSGR